MKCTAEELANKQWGSSSVTLNPLFIGPDADKYFPKTWTISKWGNEYITIGAPIPLEFKYYNQEHTQ